MKIILGERLTEERKYCGLTKIQFAEKFYINISTYRQYEKGQREPPLSLLADIAKFYDLSVDYLLGLT